MNILYWFFVRRPDVVPDVDRDQRHRVVFMQDDVEPVRQRELRERHFELRSGGRGRVRRGRGRGSVARDRGDEQPSHQLRIR